MSVPPVNTAYDCIHGGVIVSQLKTVVVYETATVHLGQMVGCPASVPSSSL